MYLLNNNVTYFDSFVVEYIPKEVIIFTDKSIVIVITNVFRLQEYDSLMRGYFYIGFIDFIHKGKKLTEFIYD